MTGIRPRALFGVAVLVLVGAGCAGPTSRITPSVSAGSGPTASARSSPSGGTWTPCETVASNAGYPPEPSGVGPIEGVDALTIVREIPVPHDPVSLGFAAGSLWVVSMAGGGTLAKIDPEAGRVTKSVELGDALGFGWIAGNEDDLWLTQVGDHSVSRLDPETLGQTTVSIGPTPDRPYTAALGHGSIWVSDPTSHAIVRIDPARTEIVATIDVRPRGTSGLDFAPSGVAVDDSAVWVSEHRADALTRIDPATNEVTATVCLGSPDPGRIVAGEGAVWVADIGGVINRVSPSSMEVQARVGPLYGPVVGSLAVGHGFIWVANASHLVRLDPATNAVDAAVLLSDEVPEDDWPGGLAVSFGAGSAWVTHPTRDVILQVTAP